MSASAQVCELWSFRDSLTVNAILYWEDCGLRPREPLAVGIQLSKEMPVAMESEDGKKGGLLKKQQQKQNPF